MSSARFLFFISLTPFLDRKTNRTRILAVEGLNEGSGNCGFPGKLHKHPPPSDKLQSRPMQSNGTT